MSGLSRQEVADRSGTDLGFVDWLIERDIIRASADGTISAGRVRVIRMLRSLEDAGIALEPLVPLYQRGDLGNFDFLEHPVFDLLSLLSSRTFRQVSDETGVPIELLMVIREAIGLAQPEPDDLLREDELGIVPFLQYQMELGFDPAAVERLLRVHGDSMRRVAETESAVWDSQVMAPRIAEGKGPSEIADTALEFGPRLSELQDQALFAIRRAHQAHQWTQSMVLATEGALARAGVRSTLEQLPAMCFLDLAGYTRLTQERGDEAAAQMASDLSRMVQRTSVRHGGRPVKWLGDGVMFHFRQPGPGVEAALAMVEAAADLGLPPAHVGLHAGPVLFQEGDYFGQTVILASRIADYARPGEVLVSDEVVSSSAGTGLTFTEIGPVELKGMAGTVRLHAAHRA